MAVRAAYQHHPALFLNKTLKLPSVFVLYHLKTGLTLGYLKQFSSFTFLFYQNLHSKPARSQPHWHWTRKLIQELWGRNSAITHAHTALSLAASEHSQLHMRTGCVVPHEYLIAFRPLIGARLSVSCVLYQGRCLRTVLRPADRQCAPTPLSVSDPDPPPWTEEGNAEETRRHSQESVGNILPVTFTSERAFSCWSYWTRTEVRTRITLWAAGNTTEKQRMVSDANAHVVELL